MRFENSVGRLLLFLVLCFSAVMAAATYWVVAGPETVLNEPINYRLRDQAGTLIRGAIVDRDGRSLVLSVPGEGGLITRRAVEPAVYSLTGYSSVQYGVGGAESAFDSILRSTGTIDDFGDAVRYDLLHLPRRGSDIRLTVSLDVQRAAAEALNMLGQPGGVVVMEASSGELLALASAPTVDPETLDARWAELVADPGRPFVNRATQGSYAVGSALSPALLAAWLIDGRDVNDELPREAVASCPDMEGFTVREAFTRHCISGFAAMSETLGQTKIDALIELFGMRTSVPLAGFTPPAVIEPAETSTPAAELAAAGFDSVTRSPLELAVMTAAIANGGNAPQPMLLQAIRPPDAEEWVTVEGGGQLMAVTTAQTASTIANAMRTSAANGVSHSDVCVGTDIGSIVAMSGDDDSDQAFFLGFAQLIDGYTVIVSMAVENADLSQANAIASAGNTILCAALASHAEG
jgi:peptidoglycan glycosyltransferase